MAGESDELKGKLKQAAGDLTENDELESEGERDELAGKAKGMMDDLTDKANKAIDSVKDSLD